MLKRSHTVFVAFLIMVSLAGTALAAGNTFAVKDMVGRSVSFSKHPRRIICLSPGTLRLIVYLQAHDRLFGIENIERRFPKTRPYFMANPQLGNLPSVGPGGPNSINKEPDYEKILALNPDVIFISYMEAGLADRVQQKAGIPVFVITYGPFGTFNHKVLDSITAVGQVLGKEKRATEVVDFIQATRRDLLTRVDGVSEHQKSRVYIGGIGFKGTHGIESTETVYAPFDWVAARNAAGQGGKTGHLFVDKERLLAMNPDIIFIDGGGGNLVLQDLQKKPDFYQGLKAFRNKQVYTLHSFNWYMTNIGTVITDAYAVGKRLYPKRFKDVDLTDLANGVYAFLVGHPVYTDMVKIHGPLGHVLPVLQ